jgi:uncharacterized protein
MTGPRKSKVVANKKVAPKKKEPKFNDDKMKELMQNAGILSRAMMASRLGQQFGGDRNLYESFGYPINPQYGDYRALYDRMGIATRLVEILPNDTWRKPAVIIDGSERSDGNNITSEFLKEWNALADRLKVWSLLCEADILCGIGRFSILFMGAPGKYDKPAGNGGVAFLSALDESMSTIQEWNSDPLKPDYGMPKTYTLTFNMYNEGMPGPESSQLVHYTRVLHISQDRRGSRVYGRPTLQTLINWLMDIEKVTGGAAEATWLTVFKGYALESKEGANMPDPGSDEMIALQQQIADLTHHIQRWGVFDNATLKDLGTDTITVRDTFDVLVDCILGAKGIPKRIFFGSEAGQLASTQDLQAYMGTVTSRQTKFAEPEILRPFINWCIIHKVLPAPTDNGKFKVWWPELYELTKTEKATLAKDVGDGAFRATNGTPENAITTDEWRSLIDLPPMGANPDATVPGSEIVPTPTGTVGNRPGKDETGPTVEAKPKETTGGTTETNPA